MDADVFRPPKASEASSDAFSQDLSLVIHQTASIDLLRVVFLSEMPRYLVSIQNPLELLEADVCIVTELARKLGLQHGRIMHEGTSSVGAFPPSIEPARYTNTSYPVFTTRPVNTNASAGLRFVSYQSTKRC